MNSVLLINPPWSRNTEPPLGLGLILAALKKSGPSILSAEILDLNAVAAVKIPESVKEDNTHRTHRAILHRESVLEKLTRRETYSDDNRYNRMIGFYSNLLSASSRTRPWNLTPGDYRDQRFSNFGSQEIDRIAASSNDRHIVDYVMPDLENRLSQNTPDIIGISITYRTQFISALILMERLKQLIPECRLVLGGAFLGSLPDNSLIKLQQKYGIVISGPGELYFQKLFNQDTVNRIPFLQPDFSGTENSRYFSPVKVYPILGSRGCYWSKCAFCDECREHFYMNREMLTPAYWQQIKKLDNESILHFCDHAIPPAILKSLVRSNVSIPWYGFVRATDELVDEKFVNQLAQTGCKMLQIGFETPVKSLLKKMNKGVDPAIYPQIIHNLKQADIRCYSYMMFGFPEQTESDCNEAIKFLETSPPDFLNASIFRLPRSAPFSKKLSDKYSTEFNENSEDRLYLDFESSEEFSMRELRRWISNEFLKSETVHQLHKKTPRYFKSSHAVFL